MQKLKILAFILVFLVPLSSQRWNSDYICGDYSDQISELNSKLSNMQTQFSALQGNVNASQGQLSTLQSQVTTLQEITVDRTASFILQNLDNGGCLQVRGANTYNLALFELATCNTSQPLQMITMHQPGGYITVLPSEKCLTVYGADYTNGNHIDQFECWTAPNQRWEFVESSDKQTFQLKVVGRRSCVNADVKGMLMTTCDDTTTKTTPSTQVWKKLTIQPIVGKLVSAWDTATKCLQSYVDSSTGNAVLKLVDDTGNCPGFQFSMTTKYMFQQQILLSPLSSNQYLTVIGGMLSSGSAVLLLPNMNVPKFKFKFKSVY